MKFGKQIFSPDPDSRLSHKPLKLVTIQSERALPSSHKNLMDGASVWPWDDVWRQNKKTFSCWSGRNNQKSQKLLVSQSFFFAKTNFPQSFDGKKKFFFEFFFVNSDVKWNLGKTFLFPDPDSDWVMSPSSRTLVVYSRFVKKLQRKWWLTGQNMGSGRGKIC